jgi:hypothetical protein
MGSVQGVASVYQVDFEDRLLAISLGSSIVGAPSALANVGSVETRGFEVGMLWEPIEHLTVFGSYSYTDSTYEDDVVTGTGDVIPTGGKTVVDTPENMLKGEVGYDNGRLFAKVGQLTHRLRILREAGQGRSRSGTRSAARWPQAAARARAPGFTSPELFIFLGDNVYGDHARHGRARAKYAAARAKRRLVSAALRERTRCSRSGTTTTMARTTPAPSTR